MPAETALPPGLIPRFLSRAQAAAYLGVSTDTFTAEVAAGTWPQGRPRGDKGGKLTWDRILLDRAADGWGGLLEKETPAAIAEDARSADELERRIYGQAEEKRRQRRHQAQA